MKALVSRQAVCTELPVCEEALAMAPCSLKFLYQFTQAWRTMAAAKLLIADLGRHEAVLLKITAVLDVCFSRALTMCRGGLPG